MSALIESCRDDRDFHRSLSKPLFLHAVFSTDFVGWNAEIWAAATKSASLSERCIFRSFLAPLLVASRASATYPASEN
jgi:hypothetical protein